MPLKIFFCPLDILPLIERIFVNNHCEGEKNIGRIKFFFHIFGPLGTPIKPIKGWKCFFLCAVLGITFGIKVAEINDFVLLEILIEYTKKI